MVESDVAGRMRAQSDVSADLNLDDLENCVLCYNQMRTYILGRCNHMNVCINCALRVRILMEDSKCQICRTDLPEVFVT
jgi:ribosomal protein S26